MNIRRIQVTSPLTLVVLSACGGSSGRCIVHSLKWNRNKWASIWGKGFP